MKLYCIIITETPNELIVSDGVKTLYLPKNKVRIICNDRYNAVVELDDELYDDAWKKAKI